MKTKQVVILAIILAVLVAGIFWKHRQKPAEFASEEYAALNLSFDAAQAAKIEISKGKGEQAAVLVKENDRWHVANFLNARADQQKIDGLLKLLRKAKGELRGQDKSLFKDFGIADEDAWRLSVLDSQGKPLLTLLLGTKKPAPESLFLRQEGSHSVYLSTADLFGAMGLWGDPAAESPKADDWAVLNLLDLKVDQVERLETKRFADGKETVTASIIREAVIVDGREADPDNASKKRWRYVRTEAPFAVEAEKIRPFLTTLNHLQATKVLDPKEKDYGFSRPRWQMKLGLEGGAEIILTAAKQSSQTAAKQSSQTAAKQSSQTAAKQSSQTASPQDPQTKASFIQVSDQPVVFQFPDYHFKNIDIDDSKFFVDNPLSIDPVKTEKLTIHADTKELTFKPKEEKRDVLTGYLNDLKAFRVAKLLFDPSERKSVQSPAHFWIEIQKTEDAPFIIDVGEAIPGPEKQYAAKKRGETQPFAIFEATYQKLFDNLDRLNEPKA